MSAFARAPHVDARLLFAYFGACFVVYGIGRAIAFGLFRMDGAAQSVFALGGIFSNNVLLGLPLAKVTLGDAALPAVSLVLVFNSLLLWTLATVTVEWARQGAFSWRGLSKTVVGVVLNPIVGSILLGTAYGFTGLPLPGFIDQTMELLGSAAIPLSLVALGMGLAGFGVAAGWRESAAMALVKLVVHPAPGLPRRPPLRPSAAGDGRHRDARGAAGRRQRLPHVAAVRRPDGCGRIRDRPHHGPGGRNHADIARPRRRAGLTPGRQSQTMLSDAAGDGMARTDLMRALGRLVARARAERRDAQSTPAQRAAWRARAERRRDFLGGTLALAAAGTLPAASRAAMAPAPAAARVVVVGGGLAGLAAMRALADAGVAATLVEASPRLGGRCWTERRAFDDGQIAERGGELVDSTHDALIDLCAANGMPLDDLLAAEPRGSGAAWLVDGAPYAQEAANADLARMLPALERDARALEPDLPTYRRYHPAQQALDRLSAAEWIDSRVDGGLDSRFGRLLANAYIEELGGELPEISAVSVVALLNGTPRERFSPYEESDQRYHVRGGNDLLVDLLARDLAPRIETGTRSRGTGANARRTLPGDGGARQRDARHDGRPRDPRAAVHAPGRRRSGACGLPPRKRLAISALGMGRNTKLQLQFRGRPWNAAGGNGETRVEGSYTTSWEVTRAQAGEAGIINFFSGGTTATRAADGTPEARAADALSDFARAYPGIAAAWNGK